MSTFLVVGGAGFLGANLCRRLLTEGHTVICVDNLITGEYANIKDLVIQDKFQFLEFDITSCNDKLEDFRTFLAKTYSEGIHGIFNLASIASPPLYIKYPIKTMLTGSVGVEATLKLALYFDCKHFFTSTSEVYGDPHVHPQKEAYNGNVNTMNSRACYDESKRYGETLCYVYNSKYGVDTKVARLFNTYGPFQKLGDGRALPNFIRAALNNDNVYIHGNGQQTRSFCYVDDTIEGMLRLYNSKYNRPVNIGNPNEELSVLELWNKVSSSIKTNSKVIYSNPIGVDPKMRKPDISLAKSLFGWEPSIYFDEGLYKLITWYKNSTM